MEKQIKCKYCKSPGIVTRVDDLFYARCTGCCKWPKYEFLGATESAAIRSWNQLNSNIPFRKGKEDEIHS